MSEVLFEITDESLESGLRGVPVGYCTTSFVDAQKGLHYNSSAVETLAYKDPVAVIYYLYTGKEGTAEEINAFKKDLEQRAVCSPKVQHHIRQMPRDGHPIKLFCAALLIAGMIEGKGDYQEDCLNLIAKIPEITAAVINHHAGWGDSLPSQPSLGYIENFVHMLRIPHPNKEELIPVFKLFDVLHFDHGGGNLSTFVGKAIASGLEDMYGSITGAMCALAGPKHGRANQDCLEFVQELINEVGSDVTAEKLENALRQRLENNQLIFGFGHAVLRVEDPRAAVLYDYAAKKYPNHPLVKITRLLRQVGSKILMENAKIADPYPNVDAISGTVLTAAGFGYPEYFTVLFGMSRTVGIAMQIVYERCEARGGKGTPIIRPKYIFKSRT